MKSSTSVSSRSHRAMSRETSTTGSAIEGWRGRAPLAAPPGRFAAQEIRHAPCGHVNEPSARIVGDAFLRPLHARCDERLLHSVFRRRESP